MFCRKGGDVNSLLECNKQSKLEFSITCHYRSVCLVEFEIKMQTRFLNGTKLYLSV